MGKEKGGREGNLSIDLINRNLSSGCRTSFSVIYPQHFFFKKKTPPSFLGNQNPPSSQAPFHPLPLPHPIFDTEKKRRNICTDVCATLFFCFLFSGGGTGGERPEWAEAKGEKYSVIFLKNGEEISRWGEEGGGRGVACKDIGK